MTWVSLQKDLTDVVARCRTFRGIGTGLQDYLTIFAVNMMMITVQANANFALIGVLLWPLLVRDI